MKKLFLLLSLVISFNAFSQIEKPITKGNIILSGGGSFQYYKPTTLSGPSLFNVSINPGFGYFVIDNLAVGMNATISYYKQYNIKSTILGVGPYVKYYFNNGLFLKAETSFSRLHNVNWGSSKEKDYSLIPGLGYAFFINQKISLEPCLSYKYSHSSHNGGTMIEAFSGVLFEFKFNIFL
jgi:hypothetical protein